MSTSNENLKAFYVPEPIGRVAASADAPSTASEFTMWAASDESRIDVGHIVAVLDTDDRGNVLGVIFAVVEEPRRAGQHPVLLDYLTHDGEPTGGSLTNSPLAGGSVLTFACRALYSTSGMYRPAPAGPVYYASADGVAEATRVRKGRGSIPYGVIENGPAGLCPVYLDEDYLSTGREAAHMLVAGKSGLASKTSAVQTLLKSTLANTTQPTAVVLVNTKGADLVFGDIPALPRGPAEIAMFENAGVSSSLTDEDLAIYEAMGLSPDPFDSADYTVWAPTDDNGIPMTMRTHPDLQHNVRRFTLGLLDVLDYLPTVLGGDDFDPKFEGVISDIRSSIKSENIQSFTELSTWFKNDVLPGVDSGARWKSHDGATVRKAYNRLDNLPRRLRGLVTTGRVKPGNDIDLSGLRAGSVYAIDVSAIDDGGQVLVITRLLEELKKGRLNGSVGVNCLCFVDEGNRLIARGGVEGSLSRLARGMREMAERSRYLGLSLVLGAQLASKLDDRVTGNLGTILIGNTGMAELQDPFYGTISPSVKRKIAGLRKGQYLAVHPKLETGAVFVRLPRPSVLPSEDARRLYSGVSHVVDGGVLLARTAQSLGVAYTEGDARNATNGLNLDQVRSICDGLTRRLPEPARFRDALQSEIGKATGKGEHAVAHQDGGTLLPEADALHGGDMLEVIGVVGVADGPAPSTANEPAW